MGMRGWILLVSGIASLFLGPGCAGKPFPPTVAPQACGNPCASMSCPAAYRCSVDGQCAARCQAEQLGNRP